MSLLVVFTTADKRFQTRTMSIIPRVNEYVNFAQELSGDPEELYGVAQITWFPNNKLTAKLTKYQRPFDVMIHLVP